MIFIERRDPIDDKWKEWRRRAAEATVKLADRVKQGEKPEIDDRIYKEAMDYLLALTKGKCAYCESVIGLTHPGDVEHFRPKGRIRDHLTGAVILRDAEREHPGYWWLAYEWTNLLPSCIDCNRRRWHEAELGGKGEMFPVRKFRALNPGEENEEQPLLLNPALEGINPSEHLVFEETGLVKPLTDVGEESCRLFGLNLREALVEERRKQFRNVRRAVAEYVDIVVRQAPGSLEEHDVRREINQMWSGDVPYGACTRRALQLLCDKLAASGFPIRLPLPG